MRFRYIFMFIGLTLALFLTLSIDPDSGIITGLPIGATTLRALVAVFSIIFYVAILHISRKGLLDYINMEELFNKAKESPQGAGLAIVGVGVIMISISMMAIAAMMNF